ncbi:MAG: TIGR04283 family arsenosugar biosynthesis glycosyltransferase [Nitrospinota bacterium]
MTAPLISVVIPAYREDAYLRRLLEALKGVSGTEAIVSVPFGDELSKNAAAPFGVKVVEGEGGRGMQLHNGAKKAAGEILLFCHADTMLPDGWKEAVVDTMKRQWVCAGAFMLSVDSPKLSHRAVAFVANIRARALGLVYGDQALFIRRNLYFECGGFKPLPIMEDVDIVFRLKRLGRFALLSKAVVTSARRWEKEGVAYSVLRNAALIILYLLGVSPEKLANWRRRRSSGRTSLL